MAELMKLVSVES